MTAIASEVVAEARRWIGTPYLHQASALGAGADCLGLLRGVWRGVYGREPEAVPVYGWDWSEVSGEERLWQAARRHLAERGAGEAGAGDLLLFRMRTGAVARHLGIASDIGAGAAFIHSYSGHGVIESPLSAAWARRIAARFSFPERSL
ncbi:C40 family peptidase [Anianabacter salinae]|uniref:peptidase n=1 Tax=Anianabacter salinae TaxID=2851023 RepID=UPI00225E5A9C|nr:peptidase [Anianabacter salinae]MBV0912952.1 peptidase [Anianabacter salinae]